MTTSRHARSRTMVSYHFRSCRCPWSDRLDRTKSEVVDLMPRTMPTPIPCKMCRESRKLSISNAVYLLHLLTRPPPRRASLTISSCPPCCDSYLSGVVPLGIHMLPILVLLVVFLDRRRCPAFCSPLRSPMSATADIARRVIRG